MIEVFPCFAYVCVAMKRIQKSREAEKIRHVLTSCTWLYDIHLFHLRLKMDALLLSSAVVKGELLKVYQNLVDGGDVNAAYVGVSPLR